MELQLRHVLGQLYVELEINILVATHRKERESGGFAIACNCVDIGFRRQIIIITIDTALIIQI